VGGGGGIDYLATSSSPSAPFRTAKQCCVRLTKACLWAWVSSSMTRVIASNISAKPGCWTLVCMVAIRRLVPPERPGSKRGGFGGVVVDAQTS